MNNVVYSLIINQLLSRLKGFAFKFKPTDVITAFRVVIKGADITNNNDIKKDVIIKKVEEKENDNNIRGDKGE